MTDIRTRLADALRDGVRFKSVIERQCVGDNADHLAGVLLSLPGIVVVEPITEQGGAPGDAWECPACSADWVAKDAGPLDIRWELAAANAAEAQQTLAQSSDLHK